MIPRDILAPVWVAVVLIVLPVLFVTYDWYIRGRARLNRYRTILMGAAAPLGFSLSRWETENKPVRDANFDVQRTLVFQPTAVDFGRYWGYDVVRMARERHGGWQLLFALRLQRMAGFQLPFSIPTTVAVMLTGAVHGSPGGRFHLRPPHSMGSETRPDRSTFAYQLKPFGASSDELRRWVEDRGVVRWHAALRQPILVFYRDGFLTLVLEVPFRSAPPATLAGDTRFLVDAFDRLTAMLGAAPDPA